MLRHGSTPLHGIIVRQLIRTNYGALLAFSILRMRMLLSGGGNVWEKEDETD